MGETTMNSAVLTATIKSMKLLQAMNTRQETIANDISEIKDYQKSQVTELEKLNAKSNDTELAALSQQLTEITSQVSLLDFDALYTKIETQIGIVHNDIKDDINTNYDSVNKQGEIDTQNIISAIKDSNKSESTATLMKLIEGLKNMQKNVQQLATRVETLSTNVTNSRKDTESLSETIRESNTRVMSMDMRMAALTNDDSSDNLDDMDSTIAFLEGFKNNDTEINDE